MVSMSDLRKNRSIYRPEVLAFASQRFNPLGITRIPGELDKERLYRFVRLCIVAV